MYPIQRDDYINAYIAAISQEMRESNHDRQKAVDQPGAYDRFRRTIARVLHRDGLSRTLDLDPVPNG